MSKIGLLIVYVFDERLQPLFDIHIERIRRHTRADFHIYAAGHKLATKQYQHVDAAPEISVFRPSVPLEFGVREEHSYCLRTLADAAFADGCEHVICMHLDSFPIVDEWEESFRGPIDQGEADVVSLVPNGYSAGLCWGRRFEEDFSPPMLVSGPDREGELFANFVTEFPDFDHVETGLGIIFTAHKNGLRWRQVGTDQNRKIYGGVLFHVVGASWKTWIDCAPIKNTRVIRLTWPIVRRAIRLLPMKPRRMVRKLFIDYDIATRDGSFHSKAAENEALMADPDGYVAAQVLSYEASELKGSYLPQSSGEHQKSERGD